MCARLRALARRNEGRSAPTIEHRGIVLDPAAHQVTWQGEKVDLSQKEFEILSFLMSNIGKVVSRYASYWFEHGDDDMKRAIFACLGSNLLLTNKTIDITLRKPFQMIFTRLPETHAEMKWIEPVELPTTPTQFFTCLQQLPIWSG